MPVIFWFQLLKCEDMLLSSSFFYIVFLYGISLSCCKNTTSGSGKL